MYETDWKCTFVNVKVTGILSLWPKTINPHLFPFCSYLYLSFILLETLGVIRVWPIVRSRVDSHHSGGGTSEWERVDDDRQLPPPQHLPFLWLNWRYVFGLLRVCCFLTGDDMVVMRGYLSSLWSFSVHFIVSFHLHR